MIRKKAPLCECGCGNEVTRRAKGMRKTHGVWNQFLPGHSGRNLSEEVENARRKKISETMKKRLKEHPEEVENRRRHAIGRKHTETAKKKMSLYAIEREKLKKASGYIVSEETRLKISKKSKGRKPTKETLLKMSMSQKGKVLSEELKKQLSTALKNYYKTHKNPFKGRNHSNESKEKMSKALKGIYTGDKASNWQGGVSAFPYDITWTRQLRMIIKERDKYTCQNPECHDPYDVLDVHRIDYDKENCNPNNLITICKKCHGRTQKNRRYWKGYYQAIMETIINKYREE